MKKKKMRPSVTKALMWRITALALGLWLCMMCGITYMCAQNIDYYYAYNFTRQVNSIDQYYHYDYVVDDEKENIQHHIFSHGIDYGIPDQFPLLELPIFDYQNEYAIVCFDKRDDEGNWATPCLVEDNNIMYFYFEVPGAETYTYGAGGYAYIELDETQFGQDIVAESKDQLQYALPFNGLYREDDGFRFERLTGWFEGNQFHLVEVADYPDREYGNGWNIWQDQPVPKEEWITVVDTAEPGQELVHIYPQSVNIRRGSTKPVTIDGVTYDNLGDMLEKGVFGGGQSSIFNTVLIDSVYFTDASGGEYLIRLATQFSSLKVAISGLLIFYVATLLILAVVLLLIYRGIRKKLVTPMKYALKILEEDSKYALEPEECWWEEAYELYVQPRDAIHELKKEVNQLSTALDYAHNAEENRRLMVSNITHELKTPLAVIHGYAEGLKEGIAADKQEHYLDVILEEAERMDGMVLEMLDLSRLEAGKVRLASDRFSLLELTRRVIDKLSLLVEEKDLTVEYVWAHDCEITADESRITQAVTNLVSNAIKYSPRGSTVHIGVTREKSQAVFSIENQSEPLSEEALAKIWDSFYRTDKSRTEKGTGLGLPITKAIIELHGGTCQVCNTAFRQENKSVTGVEFKFYLP